MRDNDVYLKQNVELDLLNTQIFTASGTWTKPTGTEYNATDTVVAMYFGAGGGGAASRVSGGGSASSWGGNGGSFSILGFNYGTIGSSLAVTIGAGGIGRTTAITGVYPGGNGGDTSFNGYILIGAVGGLGIADGERVDPTLKNAERQFLKVGNAGTNDLGLVPYFYGGNGRDTTNGTTTYPIPNSGAGGGGGSAGYGSSINRTQNNAAGISLFGLAGAGGNGSSTAVASAGNAPSGGGGGATRGSNINTTSGAGARGEIRVYVVRGKVSPSAILSLGVF
jgi:hypothetical protein